VSSWRGGFGPTTSSQQRRWHIKKLAALGG